MPPLTCFRLDTLVHTWQFAGSQVMHMWRVGSIRLVSLPPLQVPSEMHPLQTRTTGQVMPPLLLRISLPLYTFYLHRMSREEPLKFLHVAAKHNQHVLCRASMCSLISWPASSSANSSTPCSAACRCLSNPLLFRAAQTLPTHCQGSECLLAATALYLVQLLYSLSVACYARSVYHLVKSALCCSVLF